MNGAIVVNGNVAHLFYNGPVANHSFKNFELKADIMAKKSANSGVYFHTEFQPDGWTISTKDCGLSAHFEHTVAITKNGARILT